MQGLERIQARVSIHDELPTRPVLRAEVHESLNRYLEGWVELALQDDEVDRPPGVHCLGSRLTFTLQRGERTREFVGEVCGTERLDTQQDALARYRVSFAAPLWRLEHQGGYALFESQSPLDIARLMLRQVPAYASADALRVSAAAPDRRALCTQFRESDYAFFRRLMEEEGLAWWSDGDSVVVADPSSTTAFASIDDVAYAGRHAARADRECIGRLHASVRGGGGRVVASEWSASRATVVRSEGAALLDGDRVAPGLAARAHPFLWQADARPQREAEVSAQSVRAARVVVAGESNLTRLCVGATVDVVDSPLEPALRGRLLVTRVHHRVDLEEHGAAVGGYENDFDAFPAAWTWRPLRAHPRPRAVGPHTAVVTHGPSLDDDGVDAGGQVRVRFPWESARSSCRVRVAQLLAGAGYGAVFLPRPGMEVVVQFLDGDPDRPVVTGTLYNGANAPPLDLPDDQARSVLRTRTLDAERFNELRFDDTDGDEVLGLTAARDLRARAAHDLSVSVGHDSVWSVDGDASRTVGGDDALTVEGDRTVEVSGDQRITVESDARLTVFKGFKLSADDGITLTCGENSLKITPEEIVLQVGDEVKLRLTSDELVAAVGDDAAVTITEDEVVVAGADDTALTVTSDELTLEIANGEKVELTQNKVSITNAAGSKLEIDNAEATIKGESKIKLN